MSAGDALNERPPIVRRVVAFDGVSVSDGELACSVVIHDGHDGAVVGERRPSL